jgi:hypothetical protein
MSRCLSYGVKLLRLPLPIRRMVTGRLLMVLRTFNAMCPKGEYLNRVPRPEESSQSPSCIEVIKHHTPFMHHAQDQTLDGDTQRAAQEPTEFQTNSQEEQEGAEVRMHVSRLLQSYMLRWF